VNNLKLTNSTILVTGASSGIGKEFSKQLAARGANLILTARTHNDLVALANELESKHKNIWVKVIPANLTDKEAPKRLYDSITNMGLSVEYLVNSAGFGKFNEFSGESFNTYQNMLTLNITALVELVHLCLPSMKAKNNGGIINVASTGSFQPLPYQAVYGASKSFVLSFSEALSGELLDSNVRVMALCPGATESRFMKEANANTSDMTLAPANKVVDTALKAFDNNKMVIVTGYSNYFGSLIPRFISRKAAVKVIVKMFKENVLGTAT
jgi:short-subunit dehydrogenase